MVSARRRKARSKSEAAEIPKWQEQRRSHYRKLRKLQRRLKKDRERRGKAAAREAGGVAHPSWK